MTRPASLAVAVALAIALGACSDPGSRPQAGGQTNWLRVCDSSEECDGLECLCGTCTASCASDAACADLPGASCIAPADEGSIALCGGQRPPHGMCLPRCAMTCAEGTSCVAGVCVPPAEAPVRMTIDADARHQALVGFGASLAYADDAIVSHPKKGALYDLLFEESGLNVLRLRNRYEGPGATELLPAREIVRAASERLGRTPMLFMTSGTPPAALKANGSRLCGGNPETCTLASLPDGRFDYAGFAAHWRASLQAYANAGISPDYVSIQNNPNWVPPAGRPNEACRFAPEEGSETMTISGTPVEVVYPGYREALAAVRSALHDLPVMPRLGAPEGSGLAAVDQYVPTLDASAFEVLALHLYGQDPAAVDLATLGAVRDLAEELGRPVFQTEMQADGLATALLIHHALTAGGASIYLQNDFVALTPDAADVALVHLTGDGFEAQGPFYALSHYAKRTGPGWVRVDADSDSAALLGSAWLSPDAGALTVVLVNPGTEGQQAELILEGAVRSRMARTEVTRTVFDGVERSAALGELPASGMVRLPPHSIVTVAFSVE